MVTAVREGKSLQVKVRMRYYENHPNQKRLIESRSKRLMVKAGRRGGKAQPLDAKIYTPDGVVTMGDIKVGDEVLTLDGKVSTVEGIYPQGVQDIYRVVLGDGSTTECTLEHLWEIEERRSDSRWKKRSRVVTTEYISNMATLHGDGRRPTIPSIEMTAFKNKDVPISPYLLGILLGDGSMTQESISVSAYDKYIRERISEELPSGIKMRRENGDAHDYVLTMGMLGKPNPIIRSLKSLGLWGKYSHEKFIPDIYKYNSLDVRLGVIQGILDADGWVDHNGQPRLEQTSERLASDFAEVVQSLGGLCTLRLKDNYYMNNGKRVEARKVYRQAVIYKEASQLFTLPSKLNKARNRIWPVRRYIHDVQYVGKKEAQCIKISDPRGLYLTDCFIATHNTVGSAIKAIQAFLGKPCPVCQGNKCPECKQTGYLVQPKRVLYATPTDEQKGKFWFEVKRALGDLCRTKVFKLNEAEDYVERVGTENRIKAKTAWSADNLRGDYAELLILDEYQLMNEDTWTEVGAPMLLDNNGDAIFIYTPPSLKSAGVSKARDPRHASKLFKKALADTTGLWETIHFTSHDNPFISQEALQIITQDMSLDSYRREIMAQDDEIETSWLVHSKFNETLCKIKRFGIPLNWDVYSGHDFGSANPAALFIARCKLPLPPGAPAYMRQGDMVAFREYAPGPGFSIGQHVDRFKEIVKGYTVARSRGGNLNSEDEIRQGYTNAGWPIQAPFLEKKNSQIDRMVAIEEGNKLYVFDDLWMTLSEIANCMWKLDKENRPTNEIDNEARWHLSACLRYIGSDPDFKPLIIMERGPARPVSNMSTGNRVLARR